MNLERTKREVAGELNSVEMPYERRKEICYYVDKYIDLTAAETIKQVLAVKPEERKKYQHLDGSLVCRLCEKTDGEGCTHDYNTALKEWEKNINEIKL